MPEQGMPGLAICLIEAIQAEVDERVSTQVVDRYTAYRAARESNAQSDGVRALLRTFEQAGGGEQWAGKVGSFRRRYQPTNASIAAPIIERAANILYDNHIDNQNDLALALANPRTSAALATALSTVTGTEATWGRLADLAGLRTLASA